MIPINAACPKFSHQFPLNEVLSNETQSIINSAIESKELEVVSLKSELLDIDRRHQIETKKVISDEVRKALSLQKDRLKIETKMILDAKQEDLDKLQERLLETQRSELALRRKAREVEVKEKELDLEVERRTFEQLSKEKDQITKQVMDDFHRKDLEREQLISELKRNVIALKQKAEQGSQQTRGEMFEEEIGTLLRENFPTDTIEDVPKGVAGADLIQTIISKGGQVAGRIIWELKQTKSFQPAWIDKLRSDRNQTGADLAILVTETMPKGKSGAYLDHDVWVAEASLVASIAQVSRQNILDVHRAVVTSTARHDKADILYSYLTNATFRQRLESVVENFHKMKDDLEREKRAISGIWKQRELQLDSVVENTVHIYSDIQSVVGQKILNIQLLELPSGGSEVNV